MLLWHALLLGLVEGITEFLPISSTGHLLITSALLGLDEPRTREAANAFVIVIQGGAILAVLGLYTARVMQMLRGVMGRDAAGLRLAINIAIAFLPAAALGFLFHDWIDRHLFRTGPVLAALVLGGLWMIWLEYRWKSRGIGRHAADASDPATAGMNLDELDWRRALGIGLFQCIAMWPGTSRSMMTIAGGTTLGLRPRDAAEFSFLLGLPTLGGACVYRLAKDLLRAQETGEASLFQSLGATPVIAGMLVAAIAAAIAIRWLVGFLNRHGLGVFGIYRILLAGVLFALIQGGVVNISQSDESAPTIEQAAPETPPPQDPNSAR